MSPAKLTARRLLTGGALFVALGAMGAMSALPATADQIVWGNAQSWVTNGDVVTGYSTAVSFGGRTESSATAEDVHGPMGEYLRIDGESRSVVDGMGARSVSTVRWASFRMDVAALAEHGMIDVPPEADLTAPSLSPTPSPEAEPTETEGEDTEPPGRGPVPGDREPLRGDGESSDGDAGGGVPGSDDDEGDEGELRESSAPTDAPFEDPEEEETVPPSALPSADADVSLPGVDADISLSGGDADALVLDGSVADLVSADDNAVEFTLANVTSTATAGYGGVTETSFSHGDLTAFGVELGPLEADGDGVVVEDLLEVFDQDGDVVLEVPVSVTFAVHETVFDDDDPDWEGRGVRNRMTVWVQVGEDEEDQGLVVELADAWAVGSVHTSNTSPVPGDKGGGDRGIEEEVAGRDGRLATTGSSLAALITAAVVAVVSGSAATFLARGRTTAMDDRIGG